MLCNTTVTTLSSGIVGFLFFVSDNVAFIVVFSLCIVECGDRC